MSSEQHINAARIFSIVIALEIEEERNSSVLPKNASRYFAETRFEGRLLEMAARRRDKTARLKLYQAPKSRTKISFLAIINLYYRIQHQAQSLTRSATH